MIALLTLAIMPLIAVGQPAPATPSQATVDGQPGTAAPVETVEVTEQREALRKEVHAFVSDLTQSDGEFVARWNKPVCLWVSGLPAEQAEFVRKRMEGVATVVGVPFNGARDCDANLYVFFTMDPSELLTQLRKRNSRLFASGSAAELQALKTSDKPVRAWTTSAHFNSDGTPPIEKPNKVPEFRLVDSNLQGSVVEGMSSVVVVVDAARPRRQASLSWPITLTMVSFARIDPRRGLVGAVTILNLFQLDPSRQAPAEMSAWDRAFLTGLYRTNQADSATPSPDRGTHGQ